MRSFDTRSTAPELMDDPACDETKLLRTVEQFALINALLSNARANLRRYVLDDGGARLSVIDVGAGGGDIMRWLVRSARKRKVDLSVTCIDADPRIAAFAEKRCSAYPEITVRHAAWQSIVDGPRYDYVFANHLLHHSPDDEVAATIAGLSRIARRRVVISDLSRSRWSHGLFGLFAGLLFHRSFARFDGMLSIRKGFLPEELFRAATQLGIDRRTQIAEQFPGRILMIIDAKQGDPP